MQSSDGNRVGCMSANPGFFDRQIIQCSTLFTVSMFELMVFLNGMSTTEIYWKMTAIRVTKWFCSLLRVVPVCSASKDERASTKFN